MPRAAHFELQGFRILDFDIPIVRAALKRNTQTLAKAARKRLRGTGRSGRRYRKDGLAWRASRPSEYPAKVTGNLARSVRVDTGRSRRSLTMAAKVTAPHTHLLFLGWAQAEARPDVMADVLAEHEAAIQADLARALEAAAIPRKAK